MVQDTSAAELPSDKRQPPCVLLADSNAIVRFATAELLRLEGFVVLEAADGNEAVSVLAAGKLVDVIFADARMLGATSGVDLVSLASEQIPRIPTLLTSDSTPIPKRFQEAAFLPKPYRDEDVVKALRREISKKVGQHASIPESGSRDGGGRRGAGSE